MLHFETRQQQFAQIPQEDLSLNGGSSTGNASALSPMSSQSRGSFFRTKYSQWTGDRRKKDIGNAYELSMSQQVASASVGEVGPENNDALREAMHYQTHAR